MGSFLRRLIGALSLDPVVFEEVEADRSATWQALLVVVGSGLAGGIATMGITAVAPRQLIVGTLAALAAWVIWASVAYYVGTRFLPEPSTQADTGELLRTVGFAAAPGLLRVFEVIPGARLIVFPVVSVWTLAAMTIGVRQALDYTSTGRAVAVCALGWLLSIVLVFGMALTMTTPVY